MFDKMLFNKKGGQPYGTGCSYILLVVLLIIVILLSSCNAADTASYNLSKEADSFRIFRRIVFYNGITGEYMLQIEGRCSLGNEDNSGELSITCKIAEGQYKKHYLGLSDNVTYFVEQIDSAFVDQYHYLVIFRPTTIIPNIELQVP